MLVNIINTAPILLEKKLLDPKSIVNGDLEIYDISSKNRNIKVIQKNGVSLLVKQPLETTAYFSEHIKNEARFYSLIKTDPTFSSLRDILPNVLDFDKKNNILVTQFIDDAKSLDRISSKLLKGQISQQAAIMGKLISKIHHSFYGLTENPKLSFLPKTFPQTTVHIMRPGPSIFVELSPGSMSLLKFIQENPDLANLLENLDKDWKVQTLIHGDMKKNNVLVYREKNNHGKNHTQNKPAMKIIDWEYISLGDPAWDIGAIFHDFLIYSLYYLPDNIKLDSPRLDAYTERLMKKLRMESRTFWYFYLKNVNLSKMEEEELLKRSLKYCIAHLVQSAFNSLDNSSTLSNKAIYITQFSIHILKNMDDIVSALLKKRISKKQ